MGIPKGGAAKRKRCVQLKVKDHKFKIVNSCNGFLCLSELPRNDPVVVCNPITGEYLNLPVANLRDARYIDCGLGFDPKSKQHKSLPPPLGYNGTFGSDMTNKMCMGVLRGCLRIFDASSYDTINGWVMKQSGDQKSWTKEFSICTTSNWWPSGLYQPISQLKDGALLMFNYPRSVLICWDSETETHNRKYLKIRGVKSKFEAIAHIPSFISHKDAMMGDNVAVLNIKDRCAELKLQGETKVVFMEEAERFRLLIL